MPTFCDPLFDRENFLDNFVYKCRAQQYTSHQIWYNSKPDVCGGILTGYVATVYRLHVPVVLRRIVISVTVCKRMRHTHSFFKKSLCITLDPVPVLKTIVVSSLVLGHNPTDTGTL